MNFSESVLQYEIMNPHKRGIYKKKVKNMGYIEIRKLDCGVRVVMEQIPHVQSVAMGIWVKTGAVNEEAKYAGVSHYIEHMMFKGTENRNAREIAADIDKIGGQMNAFTGKEATCYYVKVLKDNFEKGAEVLLDMLTNSVFDKTELNKERQVIKEEIKMTEDQPDDLAHDAVSEMIFKGNPLGNSIIGTPTTLNRITRNVMVEYKEAQYTRDSIVIAVAGNLDPDAVCAYLSGKFDSLRASKPVHQNGLTPYEKKHKVIVKDIQQSHLCLATRAISLDDPQYYAFSILNNVMGGSMSSRLFQNIREEKGLAYSVYSMLSAFSSDGYFNIYAGISHDKIHAAIGGIREELELLGEKGITEEELSASREQLKSSYIFGQENVASRMFAIGKNLTLQDKVYTPEEVLAGLDGVTMEDIEAVKKKICDISQYSAALVTDKRVPLKKMMEK